MAKQEKARCNGVKLHQFTQQQRDVMVEVTNQMMANNWSTPRFEREIDKALEAAGCPVTDEQKALS